MPIKKIKLENFTVFENVNIEFSEGINILIGENGTGKTHIMKVLYSACQAARKDVSFSHKLVKIFRPDDFSIRRLARKQGRKTGNGVKIEVETNDAEMGMSFNNETKKWDANVINEEKWEKQLENLTSTFIPAKEILSNSWHFEAAVDKNNVEFDDTYVDIITSAKIDISENNDTDKRKKLLETLQKLLSAKVLIEKEKFYLTYTEPTKIEFQLVAEGLRKIALLWQLIKNGTLEKGSILFWDEPEANINPVSIPILVEVLLELQKEGVQIFISTHDYILAKYFEIKRKENNEVMYYSLYKDDDSVKISNSKNFGELKNNPIIQSYNALLDEVIEKKLGD